MTLQRGTTTAGLVGRTAECSALTAQIDAARLGRGSATLVCGEPGIGKTSLVEAAAATATDFSVLRCHGIEIEMALPFSGLHELLLPLAATIDELPAAQRDPLLRVFNPAASTTPPVIGVALAALTAIAQHAARQPILLLVDDVQWLDESSQLVLAFVARRIAHDPIAILMTSRTTDIQSTVRSTRIDLGPLATPDTRELTHRASGRRLLDSTADAIATATGGNPLAVIETTRLLGDRIEQFGSSLDDPLPSSELIDRAFRARLTDLPRETLDALTVAAIALTDSAATVTAALEHLGLSEDALTSAERAGIIERRLDAIDFQHPLLRSAVYHLADPELRRRCHAALSHVADDPGWRAWHAASAATRADEAVAGPLAVIADGLTKRGSYAAGARAYERAGELTPDLQTKAQRLLRAGRAARYAGRAAWASTLTNRASDAAARGSAVRLEISIERILHRAHTGSNAGLIEEMLAVAREAEGVDHDLRVDVLAMAANETILIGTFHQGADILEELERLPPASAPHIQASNVAAMASVATACRGDAERGAKYVTEAVAHYRENPSYPACGLAFHLMLNGDDARAGDLLEAVFDYVASSDDLHCLAGALGMRGYFNLLRGDWAAAEVAIEQSQQISEASRARWQQTLAISLLALVRAHRGDPTVPALVAEAEAAAAEYDQAVMLQYYGSALGLYELGRQHGAGAVEALNRVAHHSTASTGLDPNLLTWRGDFVEALVLAGEVERAHRELERFRSVVALAGVDWTRATVARLDGLLADDDGFAAHFDHSVDLLAGASRPFELARTRLHYGRRLRRLGDRTAARDQLLDALAAFDRLGATAWSAQARTELETGGDLPPRAGGQGATPALTAQERVVADCIAQGMTNKEAAAHLFLTVKTIEWHLRQIYRKLGIRSRVQLATYVNGR